MHSKSTFSRLSISAATKYCDSRDSSLHLSVYAARNVNRSSPNSRIMRSVTGMAASDGLGFPLLSNVRSGVVESSKTREFRGIK
jgi:hypothetical protein